MKTVLVIDDDPSYRALIGELLQHHGWRVLEASEGDEGITLANTHQPEIVLCDLLMPRCNGFRVCRSLRGNPLLRNTRIVATSGRDFTADQQEALAAGADEFINKAVLPDELLALLNRSQGPIDAPEARPASSSPARIKFWGVRGSIATPGPSTVHFGGNTSCVEVRADGEIIILDAGTGLRPLGLQLMTEFDTQPLELTLLLTHTHWDHIQGLPFFLPVYQPQSHLRILGYEGARHGLDIVLTGQMESPFFPVGLREVPANVRIEELKEMSFHVGAVRVQAYYANHPGICVGYRLFTSEGSVAFFPDFEPYHSHRHLNHHHNSGDTTHTHADYAQQAEQKVIEFLRGTDVLIMDAQYDRQEYGQHVGWGHACLDDVVALALKAEVKQLYLFHHDPGHDDAKISAMVAEARQQVAAQKGTLQIEAAQKGTLQIEAAREGTAVELAAVAAARR